MTGVGLIEDERAEIISHLKVLDVKVANPEKHSIEELRKMFEKAIERGKKHGK